MTEPLAARIKAAHHAHTAAIPPDDLTETDTPLGQPIKSGCLQYYSRDRFTSHGPLPEIEHLLELTDPEEPIR